VVADSDPESENQETLNKAAAVLSAINSANQITSAQTLRSKEKSK
jgi:anthranilate synthase component 1